VQPPLAAPPAGRLHIDEQGAGLLIGAYAIVVAVGSIPLSALVARFDARTTLLALLGVLTLSSGLLASSTTLPIAVIARLIGGAAHAIIFTSVYRLALAIVPIHRRGRAATTVAISNGAALAVGVPLATAIGTTTT
jgi:predicted MFS family arabinose efflux permease